jgi:hypothetical protein
MIPAMTPEQKEIARHMLGLPNKQRRSYRNRFCGGEGHSDYPILIAMQEQGYLMRVPAKRMSTVEDMWFLAPFAARLALNKDETLCPEDFPQQEG